MKLECQKVLASKIERAWITVVKHLGVFLEQEKHERRSHERGYMDKLYFLEE